MHRREAHFHRKCESDRTATSHCGLESLFLHGLNGAPVKAHANRLSHVHVLRNSPLIDGQVNDAEPLKPGSSSLLCVFRLDDVSQDRRRCCAILVCQSRVGTGTSESAEHECAQKSLEKATNRMFHADPQQIPHCNLTFGPSGDLGVITSLRSRHDITNRLQNGVIGKLPCPNRPSPGEVTENPTFEAIEEPFLLGRGLGFIEKKESHVEASPLERNSNSAKYSFLRLLIHSHIGGIAPSQGTV